jgi:hypothetical protein
LIRFVDVECGSGLSSCHCSHAHKSSCLQLSWADGKFKRPFSATTPAVPPQHPPSAATHCPRLVRRPQRVVAARPSVLQQDIEQRSATVAGAGQASQDRGGERFRGALGGRPRDGRLGTAGGGRFQTEVHTFRGVSHPSAARTGLGDLIERFLASTSRGHRRRVGGALQMAENLMDHFGLGDCGDHLQRPLTAQRTGGHLHGKHPLQELRPAPARRLRRGIVPLYALLTRCRRDRTAGCRAGQGLLTGTADG